MTTENPSNGAVVVLVDRRYAYVPVFLATDVPGREVWARVIADAKVYETMGVAQRVALQVRRRAGRAQPYALPMRAVADLTAETAG